MIFLLILFSFTSTYIILKLTFNFLKKNIIQIPNKRSSHKKNTPSAGGISFVFSTIISFSGLGSFDILCCLPISLIGFLDDFYELSQLARFIGQFLTSFIILFFNSNLINLITQFISIQEIAIYLFLLVIFVYLINAINFLDGLDGFITLPSILFSILAGFYISELYFALTAALITFIFWNWHPAKIFMGDVGSTFLGALICLTISKCQNINNLAILFSVWIPYLLDSIITIILRLIKKENIFSSHAKHLYQKLYRRGLSHAKVSIFYAFISLICLIAVLNSISLFFPSCLFVVIIGIYFNKFYKPQLLE